MRASNSSVAACALVRDDSASSRAERMAPSRSRMTWVRGRSSSRSSRLNAPAQLNSGGLAAAVAAWSVVRTPEIAFEKHTLDLGSNETCAAADINRDGKLDIVSGENWYEGPRWTKHHFRDISYSDNYIDNFSDLPVDVNGDGAPDIVSCSYFTKELYWMENPGRGIGDWKKHAIENGWSVEFVFLVDIDNDGKKRELLPQFGQDNAPLSWYELKDGAYVRHVVSPHSYGHGVPTYSLPRAGLKRRPTRGPAIGNFIPIGTSSPLASCTFSTSTATAATTS